MPKGFYPLVDSHPWSKKPIDKKMVVGVRTGEFRAPSAGEWYLSGAIGEGYKAGCDLSTRYYILQIVRLKKTVSYEIIEREGEK